VITFDGETKPGTHLLPPAPAGRGGGKGSASNDANTLRSNARARLIEAISEGPIYGLVNGAKSIFFDQTPLMNEDGTFNFKDVQWQEHKGYADEGYFNGHNAVETPVSVETQVKKATGPVVRTIVDENADAVRVILRIPALVKQTDKGLKKTSLSYAIDVRAHQGSWHTAVTHTLKEDKTLSPFQIAHRVELPEGGSPWDVRVRRITDDSDDDKLQNDLYWEGYIILVEGKFIYPHTAAIAMECNAEEMGTSIPPRTYHVKGLLVNIPVNYNPETRTYSGIWNGNFKIGWTNNPAWIFYDLLVNNRYGLGEFISPDIIDKWSLYTIAQYCDQMVPSGYRNGDTGEMIYEPRFTYNGVINSRDEAYFVLQSISQAWRGMAYWALGKVFATADMPADPVKLVTPANVIGGEFEYSGTAIKARHSVIQVKWNDPDDFYRPATEVVIDTDLLHKYGWREKTIQLRGCTSRGLAHRYGKWVIDTEQNETETLTYSASWDHAELRPGDIIAVSDPRKANIRAGGRVVSHNDLEIELDAPFEWQEGETYNLMLTMPNGQIETRAILAFLDDRTVCVASAYSKEALPDAIWSITGSDITPRRYRVLTVEETEPNIFKITALFHDPTKYARVENGISFEPLPYERSSRTSIPPTNLQVHETGYVHNGQQVNMLTLSWTPPQNFLTRGFLVTVDTPNDGRIDLGVTTANYMEMRHTDAGEYTFYVQTVSYAGVVSEPATITFSAVGQAGFPLPTVSDLRLVDHPTSTEFAGADLRIQWKNNFAQELSGSVSDTPSPHYTFNVVKIYHAGTGQLLRQERVYGETYTYPIVANRQDCANHGIANPSRSLRVVVTVSDVFGRESAPIEKTFTNPKPAATTPVYFINGNMIFMSWPAPEDPDVEGYILHRSTTPGINVDTATPYYEGGNNSITVIGDYETVYYFKLAAYDAFGKYDLNWSSEIAITTLSDGADVDPPAQPTGLILSSSLIGDGRVEVTAVWNANTEPDLAGYDFEVSTGSSWIGFPTTTPRYSFSALPGQAFEARVRARDKSGNTSPYTAVVSHTAASDTTPPPTPTGVELQAGLTSLWLKWDNPDVADFSHIEIWENSSNTFSTATLITTTPASSFARTGLGENVTRYYWLRAVDTSGNKSPTTAVVYGTTAKLPEVSRIQFAGLTFTPNSPSANRIAWTSFTATYGQAGATPTSKAVTAGNALWSSGTLYLYYVEGETTLRSTTTLSQVFTNRGHPVATYRGGTDIELATGKTLINGAEIITGTVGAAQLVASSAIITNTAQLADAIITSAKIVELDAAKLKAGTAIAETITVGSQSLATIRDWAENPVDRVNAGTTLIEPGKIRIAGATTLEHWKTGPDSTEINGGAIAANTIKANSAVIGMRGITLEGLTFEHNSPSANSVSWTGGTIRYTDDNGSNTSKSIAAGNAAWTSGTLYVYWVKGATALSTTTNFATANGDNNVILATYRGGVLLFADYGRTVIDGGQIKAQSIDTAQLKVGSVTAGVMNVSSLSAITGNMGLLSAGKIQSVDGKFVIDLDNRFISIEV